MNESILRGLTREYERGRRVWPPSYQSVHQRVFRCELCNRERPEEQRREPQSEICIKCVEEAGFYE